jgi:hypothetical protein
MSDNAPGDVFSPNQTYKSHRRWEDQLGNEVYVVRRLHVK